MDLIKEALEEFNINLHSGNNIWLSILNENDLTLDQIEKYKDVIDWDMFTRFQEVTDYIFKKYFENYIKHVKYCWENLLTYQILSEDIIDKYWEDIVESEGLDNLIRSQGLNDDLLYRAIDEGGDNFYKKQEILGDISRHQYLSEGFILENLDSFNLSNIIINQRLTDNIIKDLGGIDKIKKDYYIEINNNYLYKTDIGKDWFIAYIILDESDKRINNLYYTIFLLNECRDRNYYGKTIEKVRIYYKDLWLVRLSKKIEVIRIINEFLKR